MKLMLRMARIGRLGGRYGKREAGATQTAQYSLSATCSAQNRDVAIDTFIKFDHCYAETVVELDYPNRHTLRNWWKEYEKTGRPLAGNQPNVDRGNTTL